MSISIKLACGCLFSSVLASVAALAQVAQSEPLPSQATSVYQMPIPDGPRQGALIRSETQAPTTITWGQPASVPNVADYRVRLVDLDANQDGFLTRAEVPASHALHSEFKLVDANADGRVTDAELGNWR